MTPNTILLSPVLQREPDPSQPASPGTDPERPGDGQPLRPLSTDEVFDVLRVRRRREVLRYLDAHGGEASLGELAVHAAAVENDVAPEAVTEEQRKRVYIALHQCHLPKLTDLGVVAYGRQTSVRLRAPARRLLPYLYYDPDDGPRADGDASGPLGTLRRWWRRLAGR